MHRMKTNIEDFISLIENRPALYNFKIPDFKNTKLTEKLWEEVARECNADVYTCKSKWSNLRVSFARQIRYEQSNANNLPLKNDWYLKDNMAFMRNYMRLHNPKKNTEKSKKENPKNQELLMESSLEVQQDTILSKSNFEIKNETLLENENVSDCISILSTISDESNSETVQLTKTFEGAIYNKPAQKRRSPIQEDQSSEEPLKKIMKSQEIVEKPSSSSVSKQQKEDATVKFFKSMLLDFNKLTARRQRLLKQELMEDLNTLLDEQEN
ncbi:uncharacterized protein LOC129915849 [Episyrphus balteatus]|uniref:uncharacterized protein LOC129915849 n=1 Tax=Episyrphus balteatus TaxID=286459 RepID=UPI0024852802|nr:uncharacterized protein LOC129915849 [Episyrphus balteatus]